jgi:hypothetical protein
MQTATRKPETTDAITLIQREIAFAESERRPISRQTLADLVHSEAQTPLADAVRFVDEYCDENARWVPYYLQEEFAIPYLKVVAAFFVVLAFAALYWGIVVHRTGKPAYIYFCAGTLLIGAGAMAWVVSLERYAERRAKRRKA